MRNSLQRRLDESERRRTTDQEPGKAVLPVWLVAEFLAQGSSFDHNGRPNVKSGAAHR
jgi:hypothetical protein